MLQTQGNVSDKFPDFVTPDGKPVFSAVTKCQSAGVGICFVLNPCGPETPEEVCRTGKEKFNKL